MNRSLAFRRRRSAEPPKHHTALRENDLEFQILEAPPSTRTRSVDRVEPSSRTIAISSAHYIATASCNDDDNTNNSDKDSDSDTHPHTQHAHANTHTHMAAEPSA